MSIFLWQGFELICDQAEFDKIEGLLNDELLPWQSFELIHEPVGLLKFDEAEKTSDPPLVPGSQKISMCIELTFFFPSI